MADNKPKSPQELDQMLKDMEAMSHGPATRPAPVSGGSSSGGGALKSLLGFFIKIHDDEDENKIPLPSASAARPKAAEPVKPSASTSGKSATTLPAPNPLGVNMSGANPSGMPAPRRVGDLVADEPPPKFDKVKLNDATDRANKPFTEIYQEAGIKAAATSVDDLTDLLQNPAVASQPMTIKVVAVTLALTAKGTKIDDYIADAVRKDRALDAYQHLLNEHAREVEAHTKTDLERIQKEVEEYLKQKQAEMEQLRTQSSEAIRQSIEFSLRRQTEEERLAGIISPFLEGKPNPVTIGNDPEKTEQSEKPEQA